MSKEITLTTTKEMLNFFEAHPNLSFNQMQDIVNSYTGGELRVIRFKVIGQKENESQLKKDFIKWIEENEQDLDNSKLPVICFLRIPKD